MDQNPTMKLAAAVATLVGIWIAVYWMWEPARAKEPSISFAAEPEDRGPGKPQKRTEAATAQPGGGNRAAPRVPEGAATPKPGGERPAPVSGAAVPGEPGTGTTGKTGGGEGGKPPVVVNPPKFEDYRVLPGETFETIAKKRYGSSAMQSAIARANPFVDPRRLKPGRVIRLPVDPGNIQGTVERSSPAVRGDYKTYKVEEGDTLSGISKKYYGTTALARRIYEANTDRLKNEHDLKLGLELLIPPPPDQKKETPSEGSSPKPGGDTGR